MAARRLFLSKLPLAKERYGGYNGEKRVFAGGEPSAGRRKGGKSMIDRFIVFDVETPNSRNDRMSAIGVSVIHKGEIVEEFSTLVDPETYFARFNIELTGITPAMAAEGPRFPELWEKLRPTFESGILAAHFAPFDLSVLGRCLEGYGISWKPYVRYVCTVVMGRACYPELPNHKLNTLCAYRDIPLNHHDAGSDSHGAAELLLDYMRRGLDIGRYIRTYNFEARLRSGTERSAGTKRRL